MSVETITEMKKKKKKGGKKKKKILNGKKYSHF